MKRQDCLTKQAVCRFIFSFDFFSALQVKKYLCFSGGYKVTLVIYKAKQKVQPIKCFSDDASNATDDDRTKDEKKIRKVRKPRKNSLQDISATEKKRIDKYIHDHCRTSGRHSMKSDAIRKAVGM